MDASLRTAMTVTAVLLAAAAAVRVLVIPRFTVIPGHVQLALEQMVNFLDRLGRLLCVFCLGLKRK